jgi:choline kinase
MIRRAVILAAGQGSRMGGALPKPLVRVAGVALAERVVRSLLAVGIREVAVVVGHRAREVTRALSHLPVQFIENRHYQAPNGLSVCAAETFIRERTLLVMVDHVFASSMLEPLVAQSRRGDELVLAVDRAVTRVFDLEDATKVRTQGSRIADIGKTVSPFDAIDTGLFCIPPLLCRALAALPAPQLSDGVRALARFGLAQVADVTGARWVDVDTPRAQAAAERLLSEEPGYAPAA